MIRQDMNSIIQLYFFFLFANAELTPAVHVRFLL